jgi:transketolase
MTELKGKTADFKAEWGKVIVEIAENDPRIVVIDADLAKAAGSYPFRDAFPDRHFNVGISEQDMVGFACGLADCGKIPFVSDFGCFIAQRACDQLINGVAYNHLNVKFIGMGAGLTCAKNGGTHMSINDIAIVRSIPGFMVFDPADTVEFASIVKYAAANEGTMYIRSNRGNTPVIHSADYQFSFGKAEVLRDGNDITLVTTGITTAEGIRAAETLYNYHGISVLHLHIPTIKPVDNEALINAALKTGCVVTCENHSVLGGLGSVVCEVLSEACPTPVYRLGLQDVFGETADLPYLCHKYRIDAQAITDKILAIRRTSKRFNS